MSGIPHDKYKPKPGLRHGFIRGWIVSIYDTLTIPTPGTLTGCGFGGAF